MTLPTLSELVTFFGNEEGATIFYECMIRTKLDLENQRREFEQGGRQIDDDLPKEEEDPPLKSFILRPCEVPKSGNSLPVPHSLPSCASLPSDTTPCDCDCYFTYDITGEQERLKRKRESDAMFFLPRPLTYDYNCAMNQKYTCIWSRGLRSFTEALTGFTWVAVHGMTSACVATRITDLEQELNLRMAMFGQEPKATLRIFRNGLIGKVEEFVDPAQFRRPHPHHQIIKKPFGVVSVVPYTKIVCTLSGHEALSAKYDEENAIKFLQYEMESGAVFTYNKTVETAISALGHLFHQKFKASEIQVFVWRKKDGRQAKALTHIRKHLDIEEHLAPINNNRDSCVREEDLEKEEILEIEEEQLAAMNKPECCGVYSEAVIRERMAAMEKRARCYRHSLSRGESITRF